MINLLELTKRQVLIASAVTVALGIALVIGGGLYVSDQAGSLNDTRQHSQDEFTPVVEPGPTQVNDEPLQETPASDPLTGATETVQPAPVAQQPAQATPPVAAQTQPSKPQLERIPFTLKDVIPGNPESYIGTYGQCPFYENAGDKGCYPPPYITCNADWTYCEIKKQ
jgi:hypothetical protein